MTLKTSSCRECTVSVEPRLGFTDPAGGAVQYIFKLLETGRDLTKQSRNYDQVEGKFCSIHLTQQKPDLAEEGGALLCHLCRVLVEL